MKNVKSFEEFANEALITLSGNKRVEVPEKDITDVIKAVQGWFDKNTTRDVCNVSIFGYDVWPVNKDTIEEDVRECAKVAKPYKKANEGIMNIFKSDVKDFTKEEKPKPHKRNTKYDWAKTKEDIAKSKAEEEEEEEEVVAKYTRPTEPDIRGYQNRRGQYKYRDISKYKKVRTVNEEITDEYIDKGVVKAKENGRMVSEPYTNVLKKRNVDQKRNRTLVGAGKLTDELNTTFKDIVEAKITDKDAFSIVFKSQNYALNYYGYQDNFIFFVQGNEKPITLAIEAIGSLSDPSKKVTFFNYLSSLFKKYIPESKFADRRIWSTLK